MTASQVFEPAVINDVMVSDVAAEHIGFNDLLRSLCPYCVWTWKRWRVVKMQRVKKIYGFPPAIIKVTHGSKVRCSSGG